jgi:HEAT repeat protein
MSSKESIEPGLPAMIADYMEKGFLENIIDMFKHDSNLYSLVGELIQDERVRVRVGVTAMMEELSEADRSNAPGAARSLLPLLRHKEDVIRGDAANLLGIIGCEDALQELKEMTQDKNPSIRLIAEEAIEDIRRKRKGA